MAFERLDKIKSEVGKCSLIGAQNKLDSGENAPLQEGRPKDIRLQPIPLNEFI